MFGLQCRTAAASRALGPRLLRLHTTSHPNKPPRGAIADRRDTESRLKSVKRSLWGNQFVLDNFDIPGKFQKFFTGRLRKREVRRHERQLNGPVQTDELVQVGARNVVVDEALQVRKMRLLRDQIVRILEAQLASDRLPVRQLSLQHWEITDVLVSFNLKSAVCCYKVTSADKRADGTRPHDVRRIIGEASEYLNAIVNQELAKGARRKIGTPPSVRIRFVSSTDTSKILERMHAELQAAEPL
ncbi:hypothetical protein LPJ70_005283 [Coemansia sp. RSA 2708]|nr:hypothetical protein LPJ70_005283 [Coemansia sp. RSA 2708]